jgi:hypothetical protein
MTIDANLVEGLKLGFTAGLVLGLVTAIWAFQFWHQCEDKASRE